MPTVGKIKPKDAKTLLKKLRAHAKDKDDKAICSSVQADLGIGGTAQYQFTSESSSQEVHLPSEQCLIFLIVGSFTLDNESNKISGRGFGHYVEGASILRLQPETALVIISDY